MVSADPVDPTCSGGGGSLLSSLGMAGFTSIVESKGMDLVTGGLGALEFIGKKTMDVISEGDHGLRHKRQLLAGKGESLSQVRWCRSLTFLVDQQILCID